jgi:outer membrane protein OmpA-like peptidoglycan-associated protein
MKTTRIVVIALGFLGACATAPPPELVDARAEFQRASAGPAAQQAPDALARAQQALASADASFAEHPNAQRTRDLAYAAKREAEVAESAARAAVERDRRTSAQADVAVAQKQIEERATSAEERARAEAAARAEADRARQLQASEAQESKLRADSEQQQRALDEQRHKSEVQTAEQARSAAEMQAARASAERDQAQERAQKEQTAREQTETAMRRIERFATVKSEARGKIITLNGSVLFTTGTARLLPSARERLDEVAAALETEHGAKFTIKGFTDARGTAERNLKLSQARADSVRDYLVSQGVEEERVRAIGMGEDSPVASNTTPDGRANNRRVEIIVGRQQAER